ncbi:hypothetical protein AB3N59_18000 [Leptospira sp. WS92.C1]
MESKFQDFNCEPLPAVLDRGERIYLFDIERKRYFDFLYASSTVNHGLAIPNWFGP